MHKKEKQREEGVCACYGCQEQSGEYAVCQKHRELSAGYSAAYLRRRREAGKCVFPRCEATANLSPGGRCPEHRLMQALYQRKYARRLKREAQEQCQ